MTAFHPIRDEAAGERATPIADIPKLDQTFRMIGTRRRLLAFAFIAAVLATVAFVRCSPMVAQDACLDAGGAWHEGKCVH